MDNKRKPPLPFGWTAHVSKRIPTKVYYYNTISGDACWDINDVINNDTKEKDQPKPKTSHSSPSNMRKRKSSFGEQQNKCKARRSEPSLSASSGYGNSMGTPSAASTVSDMEICEPMIDDIVMMEIDDLRQNFRQSLHEPKSEDLKRFSAIKEVSFYRPAKVQVLYIIIDTNVLLTTLSILESLVLLSEDDCKVILIIPWIVLQELDELKVERKTKKNFQVNKQARAAIRYLHCQLADSTTSIQGQSIEEATRRTSSIASTNDDHILLCCKDYNKRVNSSAIILTNDKNLCVKALSNNCLAFVKDEIFNGITKHMKKVLRRHEESVDGDDDRGENLSKFSPVKIYNSFKTVLFITFKEIVEVLMRLVYDDSWKTIVKVKPPWNLEDIFNCFIKHWYAVFGFIFSKQHEEKLLLMKTFFHNDRGRSETLDNIKSVINDSIKLCLHLQKSDLQKDLNLDSKSKSTPYSFQDQLSNAIEKLGRLSTECESKISISENSSKQTKEILCDPHNCNCIKLIFRDIGDKIRYACAVIGHPLGIKFECNQTVPILTQEEVTGKLNIYNPLIENLFEALNKAIKIESEYFQEAEILPLFTAIKAFYSTEDDDNLIGELSLEILYSFCALKENKEYLMQGREEIFEFGKFLQKCAFSNIT